METHKVYCAEKSEVGNVSICIEERLCEVIK
jgi:hypothetical protein